MAKERAPDPSATREKIETGKRIVRGKLARWLFRWTLTGVTAAVLLPRYPGWVWLLYVLIPLGLLNLFLLLRVYVQLKALEALVGLGSDDGRK